MTDATPRNLINVVIAGAGPAGILTAIHLLRRNEKNDPPCHNKYKVTLVDPGVDFGNLTLQELQRKRSWVIGLSAHGLSAVREIPGLYEDYVSKIGIPINSQRTCIRGKEVAVNTSEVEAHGVDRNHVVAALARYLNEHFLPKEGGSPNSNNSLFVPLYNSKVIFVDGEKKRVLIRGPTVCSSQDNYVPYDLLIGCDGVRSCVRFALLANHRDFEFSIKGTFGFFKSVHVDLPDGMDEKSMYVCLECLPNMGAICLPEVGSKLNVIMGYGLNKKCDEEMKCSDPDVVRHYIETNFRGFSLNADDFAKQWTKQSFSSTGQVHCNFYHSSELSIIIMGDAAHATSPNIGQGMNTALADAAAFNSILDEYEDNIDAVLPAFSRERVKEGNALTELSFHYFSLSEAQFILLSIRRALRTFFHKHLPFLISEDPYIVVGKGGKLSECYNAVTHDGSLEQVRRTNERIYREHFEKETGMVMDAPKGCFGFGTGMYVTAGIAMLAMVSHLVFN